MSVQNDPITERKRIATWWMKWEDLRWPNADNLSKIKARAEEAANQNGVSLNSWVSQAVQGALRDQMRKNGMA